MEKKRNNLIDRPQKEAWVKSHKGPLKEEEGEYHLGYINYKLKDLHEAIKYFKKAIKINPHYKEALEMKTNCDRILKQRKNNS